MLILVLPWVAAVGAWIYGDKLASQRRETVASIPKTPIQPMTSKTASAVIQSPSLAHSAALVSAALVSQGPVQMTGDPIQAIQGQKYRATVVVHFPASLAANVSTVQREAEKAGFTSVTVTKNRPADWPGANGDYYVSGIFSAPQTSMTRSHGGGQVNISDIWQG